MIKLVDEKMSVISSPPSVLKSVDASAKAQELDRSQVIIKASKDNLNDERYALLLRYIEEMMSVKAANRAPGRLQLSNKSKDVQPDDGAQQAAVSSKDEVFNGEEGTDSNKDMCSYHAPRADIFKTKPAAAPTKSQEATESLSISSEEELIVKLEEDKKSESFGEEKKEDDVFINEPAIVEIDKVSPSYPQDDKTELIDVKKKAGMTLHEPEVEVAKSEASDILEKSRSALKPEGTSSILMADKTNSMSSISPSKDNVAEKAEGSLPVIFDVVAENYLPELKKNNGQPKISLFMASCILVPFILSLVTGMKQMSCLTGFIHLVYLSSKATESRKTVDGTQWLMCWMVFALSIRFETIVNSVVQWIPSDYSMKILFFAWFAWLFHPLSIEAVVVYDSIREIVSTQSFIPGIKLPFRTRCTEINWESTYKDAKMKDAILNTDSTPSEVVNFFHEKMSVMSTAPLAVLSHTASLQSVDKSNEAQDKELAQVIIETSEYNDHDVTYAFSPRSVGKKVSSRTDRLKSTIQATRPDGEFQQAVVSKQEEVLDDQKDIDSRKGIGSLYVLSQYIKKMLLSAAGKDEHTSAANEDDAVADKAMDIRRAPECIDNNQISSPLTLEDSDAPVYNITPGSLGLKKNSPSNMEQDCLQHKLNTERTEKIIMIGTIVGVPLVIAVVIVVTVLCVFFLSFLLVGMALTLVMILGTLPLCFVLNMSPQMQLLGYNQLPIEDFKKTVECSESRKSKWHLLKKSFSSNRRKANVDIPWIAEAHNLLSFSDYVYILSDFRKMSIMGKCPVEFKFLSLECDQMSQWDIIKGQPHKIPAFDENGNGIAGIRPSVLMITVLRFLVSEAKKHQIEYIGDHSGRLSPSRNSCNRKGGMYRGLDELENLFLRSVKDTSYSCDRHHLGGTLCKESGLHGVQCFLDALIRESKNGDSNAQELIDLLSTEVHDEEFDLDCLKINMLMIMVAASGKVFTDASYSVFKALSASDTRIVWTNDRAGDAECLYLIAVSYSRSRVIVIFRGTSTISDMLADVNFVIRKRANPIEEDYPGKMDSIELHGGFCEYLFDKRDDTGRTKFGEIADRAYEYGEELGEGGFSLYVSGHSLGGSLSQLFGFYASCDERFAQKGNPVRVFSFASAIPGRISFAKAFQHQEKIGLIQHLRVHNDNDIIPLTHPQTGLLGSVWEFAQTGISVCLQDDNTKLPYVKYFQDLDWWGTLEANVQTNMFLNFPWSKIMSAMSFHGTESYMTRIELATARMKEHGIDHFTLNDLYKHYVGVSVDYLKGGDCRRDKRESKFSKHVLSGIMQSTRWRSVGSTDGIKLELGNDQK